MTNPSLQSRRIPNIKCYSTLNLLVVWFCVVGLLKNYYKESVKDTIWPCNVLLAVYFIATAAFCYCCSQNSRSFVNRKIIMPDRLCQRDEMDTPLPLSLRTSWQIWALGCCHNRAKQATWDTSLGEPRVGTCVYEHLESGRHSRLHGDATKKSGVGLCKSARCLIGERQGKQHYAQTSSPLLPGWETDRHFKHGDCAWWNWKFFGNIVTLLKATICAVRKWRQMTMYVINASKRTEPGDSEMNGLEATQCLNQFTRVVPFICKQKPVQSKWFERRCNQIQNSTHLKINLILILKPTAISVMTNG